MRVISNLFFSFFLLKALVVQAKDQANVMIGMGGQVDLTPCDPWAEKIEKYIVRRAERYVGNYIDVGGWSLEITEGGDRKLEEEQQDRDLSCALCNRCKAYGFPYCYALYYCNGCRRNLEGGRQLNIPAEHIVEMETKIAGGCSRLLKKASRNMFPRVGLSNECMAALGESSCKATVEEI